ncbi:MAG: hypothetical protein CV087_10410 [Candidatus Brocadia sp. WS118]|nr:MAG: hypothetical protein CV087_10410 [Candidatus Brocadia sp. WS118]
MAYENLKEEVERIRKEHRLSLLEMSNKTGLNYETLRRIEEGKTKNAQEATLRAIAKAFNLEIQEKDNCIYFVEPTEENNQVSEPEGLYLTGELAEFYEMIKHMEGAEELIQNFLNADEQKRSTWIKIGKIIFGKQ